MKAFINGDESHNEPSTSTTSPVVEELVVRARTILSELEQFRLRIRKLRQEGTIELAHYRSTVQSELEMLEKLSQKPESEATNHVARSSNLPFLEAVWSTAKRSSGLNALLKRVYLTDKTQVLGDHMQQRKARNGARRSKNVPNRAVTVDIITDSGRTWAKVSLVTNTRLLFDLAKEGWDSGGSEDDYDSNDGDGKDQAPNGNEDNTDIPLVKTARELTAAARTFRVRTQQPKVHLTLPRITLGETPEVDKIIERCRAVGATVTCGEDPIPPPPLSMAAEIMAPDPIASFSDILNIDCTILLALVSEFSHARVSKEPWFHKALQRQVEIEDNENLLPLLLYPALGHHALTCTTEAATRMQEIVATIGTPSEKARTAIFMSNDTSKTRSQLLADLQQWSAYEVPSDLQLPIQIVPHGPSDSTDLSAPVLAATAPMTAINRSVFLYGWTQNLTTITSNRTVVKQIDLELEKFTDLTDSVWPKIWLCPTARSLVGKEKRGAASTAAKDAAADRDAAEGHDEPTVTAKTRTTNAWRMPDPLRREQQRRHGLDVLGEREGGAVEDFRPGGYPCEEVLAAKMASLR